MKLRLLSTILCCAVLTGTNAQVKNKTMNIKNNNPLLCDVDTGICELPGPKTDTQKKTVIGQTQPIKIIYYTDPICSSCWGIEPQLRKLKLEYGNTIEIEYRMGGLLPDWSYNSGGISKPSDVAHHWDEVSHYYDMPIDGDVWLEDPLASSYPPSIAFKAAEMQDRYKAILFLREIREMVFLQKKNIAKWEHLKAAADKVGLNTTQMKTDMEGKAKEFFQKDLELGRELGVRGFPTMFFTNNAGNKEMVYGSKPYAAFETAVRKLHPQSIKQTYDTSWQSLFSAHNTMTLREFTELSGLSRVEAEKLLQQLTNEGHLKKYQTKNGSIWSVKDKK